MPRKKRGSFSAEQKAAILRRHHVDKVPVSQLCEEDGLQPSVFYYWQKQAFGNLEIALQSRERPGANEHNGKLPRDHWLTDDDKQAILDYHDRNPLEGYRRLTFMMLDHDIAAASPSSIYRVLRAHNRLDRWNRRPSKKGTGFKQPSKPHEYWHTTRCGADRLHQHRRHLLLPLIDPRRLRRAATGRSSSTGRSASPTISASEPFESSRC